LKIFSLTILIERNGRKFGCLSASEFRICSEARFRIVEKMLLSNEEPCLSETSQQTSIKTSLLIYRVDSPFSSAWCLIILPATM